MTSVQPFLMFQGGDAEAAMNFYVSLFDGGKILDIARHEGNAHPESQGQLALARFSIGDQIILCSDSPVRHSFTFTPSSSLFVECADEAELDRLFAALGEGGQVLMPLDNYGFSRKFGWLNDRFGVSWQLNWR